MKGIELKMRAVVRVTSLMLTLALVPGCFWNSKKEDPLKVINVLEKKFFTDAHIPGSEHVPVMDVEKVADKWSKDTKIVVYCSNYACSASRSIARKLKKLKFKEVYAYEAGMAGWKQAGLPVHGPGEESYLTLPNKRLSDVKHVDVEEITTEQLKAMLEEAGKLTDSH
jgi:rhodanese-related sulfurtransferase